MARRTKRCFGEDDAKTLLAAAGTFRHACIQANMHAEINSEVYRKSSACMTAIDDLAEVLTGDRAHFHIKMGPARTEGFPR